MILNKKEILSRINNIPPMVSNFIDINSQIQPAGLDLSIKNIFKFDSAGHIDFNNSKRKLSKKFHIKPNFEEIFLQNGVYQIEVNETFNIPLDIVGKTTSRSSLQRCGGTIEQGFFDPGYIGGGYILLNVINKEGIYLYKNARVCQIAFHLTNPTEGYNGAYQDNNIMQF